MAQATSSLKTDHVNSVRLPWHRAQLYFLPTYPSSAAEWAGNVSALVQRAHQKTINYQVTVNYDWNLQILFDRLELTIDPLVGWISLDEQSDDLSGWDGPFGPVRSASVGERPFDLSLERATPPAHLEREFSLVEPLARRLHALFVGMFDRAVSDGLAVIEAKYHSVSSPFVRVEPDEIRHLHFSSVDRDIGEDTTLDEGFTAAGNEPFFSFSVRPTRSLMQSGQKTAESPSVQPAKGKRGPSSLYNWPPIEAQARKMLTTPKGLPDRTKKHWTKEQFRSDLLDWCEANGYGSPAPTTIDEHIDPIIGEFKKVSRVKKLR